MKTKLKEYKNLWEEWKKGHYSIRNGWIFFGYLDILAIYTLLLWLDAWVPELKVYPELKEYVIMSCKKVYFLLTFVFESCVSGIIMEYIIGLLFVYFIYLFIQTIFDHIKSVKSVRFLALFFFFISFLFFLCIWILYDPFQSIFQFWNIFDLFGIFFCLGLDSISLFFLFLVSLLFSLCCIYGWYNKVIYFMDYLICLISMHIILLFIFLVMDLFLFYVFFESILIPLFIFIGLFGSKTRKIHAAYLLFFYTLFGSLLMLGAIFIIYSSIGSLNFLILYDSSFSFLRELLLCFAFFFSFSIKIPLFPFHIWLPEAHVEAPTEGSVILAGILLKLGGYAIFRLLLPIFTQACIYIIPFVFVLANLGIIYISISTLRQLDLKRVIAFSSIAHMNMAMLGLFSFNLIAFIGSFLLFIAHGLVSSGLFFLIGMLYSRYKTRLIKYYGGLVYFMPLFSLFFFLFLLGNLSFPGTINFVAEVLIFYVVFILSDWSLLIFSFGIFFCMVYSILLFSRIVFGLYLFKYFFFSIDLNRVEFNILFILFFFLVIFGFYPSFLIDCYSSVISVFLFL